MIEKKLSTIIYKLVEVAYKLNFFTIKNFDVFTEHSYIR